MSIGTILASFLKQKLPFPTEARVANKGAEVAPYPKP